MQMLFFFMLKAFCFYEKKLSERNTQMVGKKKTVRKLVSLSLNNQKGTQI